MTRRIIRLATFQKRIHMPLEAHSQEKVVKLFVRLFKTFFTQPLCTTPPLSPSHRKGQFVLHEASHLSQNFPLNNNYEMSGKSTCHTYLESTPSFRRCPNWWGVLPKLILTLFNTYFPPKPMCIYIIMSFGGPISPSETS